ncbi:hypothetical protein [Ralstonia syzygii]|nr:hypothetical protein [Ralstonia syzygii]
MGIIIVYTPVNRRDRLNRHCFPLSQHGCMKVAYNVFSRGQRGLAATTSCAMELLLSLVISIGVSLIVFGKR